METAEEWSGVRGQHGQQFPFDPTQIAAVPTFVILHPVDLPCQGVQRPDMRLAALWLLTTVYIFYICQPNLWSAGDRWAAAIPYDSAAKLG